jgi:FKBP-type peptidyl-prolyl cis-trans isomerase 2
MQHLDAVQPGTTHEYKVVASDAFGNYQASKLVRMTAK